MELKRKLAVVLFVGTFSAWGKPTLELTNKAFIEKEETAKNGKKISKLVAAKTVTPGDEVTFELSYKNISETIADDVVITNPIPKNMLYRDAMGGTDKDDVYVSVDNGLTYGKLAELKVTDKMREARPALASDVTHVQWKVGSQLEPKKEGKVRLLAVLK